MSGPYRTPGEREAEPVDHPANTQADYSHVVECTAGVLIAITFMAPQVMLALWALGVWP